MTLHQVSKVSTIEGFYCNRLTFCVTVYQNTFSMVLPHFLAVARLIIQTVIVVTSSQIPTAHPCNPRRLVGAAMGVASSNEEPEDHYNPYDEIPGDSRQENLYDEIHPKTRVISTSTQENLSGSTDLRLPRPRGAGFSLCCFRRALYP